MPNKHQATTDSQSADAKHLEELFAEAAKGSVMDWIKSNPQSAQLLAKSVNSIAESILAAQYPERADQLKSVDRIKALLDLGIIDVLSAQLAERNGQNVDNIRASANHMFEQAAELSKELVESGFPAFELKIKLARIQRKDQDNQQSDSDTADN